MAYIVKLFKTARQLLQRLTPEELFVRYYRRRYRKLVRRFIQHGFGGFDAVMHAEKAFEGIYWFRIGEVREIFKKRYPYL